ncbi:MAG: cysteine--tRNA ligase [Anaerolineales bacterium]
MWEGPIRLFNTLTRRIEPVHAEGPAVRVYVCGITPYDTTHLGHAFTYTSADLLVRALESRGRKVLYVQNVTDIDDDILRKAAETGGDWRAVGNRWTEHYIRDMISLNVRPPDHLPRASGAVPEILESVLALLSAGLAYVSGGSVYYDLAARPDYGVLSRLPRDEMLLIANERGNVPDDPHKRDPLDFVLWQAQKPGEPAWPSPWGAGRPGWHIECSTLVQKFLGPSLDVHGGGEDLIFPHHESEIAQIEPLTGRPFAHTWMHTSMVQYEGAKMSKSLGNLVMMEGLLGRFTPDAIRIYLASHHYRSVWTHDETALQTAAEISRAFESAASAAGGAGKPTSSQPESGDFERAMEEDLDSPEALVALERLARRILDAAGRGETISTAQAELRGLGAQLGLRIGQSGPEPRVARGWGALRQRFLAAPESARGTPPVA